MTAWSQGAQACACLSLWVLWSWQVVTQVYKLPWFCQQFDRFFHLGKQQVQGLAVAAPAGLRELLPQGGSSTEPVRACVAVCA